MNIPSLKYRILVYQPYIRCQLFQALFNLKLPLGTLPSHQAAVTWAQGPFKVKLIFLSKEIEAPNFFYLLFQD